VSFERVYRRVEPIVTLVVVNAGYSGSPLVKKLGIKANHRVTVIGAAREWTVPDLPASVRLNRRRDATTSDVVIAFFREGASLEREIAALSKSITTDGALWIAWPRKAAGHRSDITDNVVRAVVLPLGLVDVKVAALDDDWSSLKMVWRKELRVQHA